MKILIAVPCMSMLPVEYVNSLLKLEHEGQCDIVHFPNSLIYSARDKLAFMAVQEKYDYLLFIDSDMVVPPDSIKRLLSHKKDIVCGLYFKRQYNYEPVIYKELKFSLLNHPTVEPITDYKDGLIEIEGCGMGLCLIKTEVFKTILQHDYSCFEPLPHLGEDFAFCIRARNSGYKIYCDTTLKCGHVGTAIIEEKDFKGGR